MATPPAHHASRRFARYLLFLAGSLLVWLGFAALLVPELLRLSHEGRSIPLVSALMAGRETTPLDAYAAVACRLAHERVLRRAIRNWLDWRELADELQLVLAIQPAP